MDVELAFGGFHGIASNPLNPFAARIGIERLVLQPGYLAISHQQARSWTLCSTS